MRHLQIDRVEHAISSPDRNARNRAIDWLSRQGDIAGLIRVLNHGKHEYAMRRVEAALAKFSFK